MAAVYDLETGDLCDLTVPALPEGWHAVMDRRCGPTGQLLFYNEETEQLTATAPGAAANESPGALQHWRPTQKNPLAAEFERTRSDLEGFLAGGACKSALQQKLERVEQMQLNRSRTQLRSDEDEDVGSNGPQDGWNGYNAVVRAVKRVARDHPLGTRQKVQTAEATRIDIERYTASQSLWQCLYCGACLMCVGAMVFVLTSVHVVAPD